MILASSMVGIMLMACSFLVMLLIIVMILVVHIKTWYEKRMEESDKRFIELKERIDDTQHLFRNEVVNLINRFDKLISGMEKKNNE